MQKVLSQLIFLWVGLQALHSFHLETDPFILETKQIIIPSYPFALNPSIVRWKGKLLLSFRIVPDPTMPFTSQIGLVWLNDDFEVISEPQILPLHHPSSSIPPRAGDGRLIAVNNRLYLIYDDCKESMIYAGCYRLFVCELQGKWGAPFSIASSTCLSQFPGQMAHIREKNWVPFECGHDLFFAYSLSPHIIFRPHLEIGVCESLAISDVENFWEWGHLRGGTPAIQIGDEYLAFFHSSKKISSPYSSNKPMLHYVMGAYTFSAYFPFEVHKMSSRPIFSPDFFSGPVHPTYKNWSSMRGVFPGGILVEGDTIWIVFGKQDHEMWVVKLDKKGLLDSLVEAPHLFTWEEEF